MAVVRVAREDDVPAIAALSAAQRARLEDWSPLWWRRAAAADDLHPLWVAHLVASDGPVARVAVDDQGAVRAAAITHDQGSAWFVDDVVADDDDAGRSVLSAVTERPALTCVPTDDEAGARRAAAAGWARVSSYWIGSATGGPAPTAMDAPTEPPAEVPPHTFGGALGGRPAGRALADGAWGAGGLPAPPVYDPGGPVTVVVAVAAPDRVAAVRSAVAEAAGRGDVLVALVVAEDDADLAAAAESSGLVRTVDVWSAPPLP